MIGRKRKRTLRFQESPWPIKLWRFRYYLLIPYKAIKYYLASKSSQEPMSFSASWSVAIGMAQVKMYWYYTIEETVSYLQK